MKQIEEYVNKVYRNMKGNKKDIQDLKNEMKSHLLESIHELKLEGKSEEEAVAIAIERFGKENELRSIIRQVLQTQKTFGEKLLYAGLGIFLLSIIIFGITISPSNELANEQAAIADEILDTVSREQKLLNAEEEIEDLIKKAKFPVGKLEVRSYTNEREILYEYSTYDSPIISKLYSVYFIGNSSYGVYLESKSYAFVGIIVLFVGGTAFVLFFTLWAIIRAYHKRKSNLLN